MAGVRIEVGTGAAAGTEAAGLPTTVIDLADQPAHAKDVVEGLLERVALALTSTLELPEVLRLLSEITIECVAGPRCSVSVFVLEERRLRPAAAIGSEPDEERFQSFLAMGPIQLDDLQLEVLAKGEPVVIDDAAGSDLVPQGWVRRFGVRTLALFPLTGGGEPGGLMAVDWRVVRPLPDDELRRLEAVATCAGIAVANARLYGMVRRRAQLREALARAAATLASPLAPHEIVQRLVDAYAELLGTRMCAVVLLDSARDQVTTAASRGTRPIGAFPVSEVPDRIVERLWHAWEGEKQPVEVGADPWLAGFADECEPEPGWYLFVPLVVNYHSRGVVVLGFGEGATLDGEERSAVEALADIAAAALERHELLDRLDAQVERLDALYQASSALNSSSSLPAVLDHVCASFDALLGTSHCSVNLVVDYDPLLLRTLAHRGEAWFAGRPESLGAVSCKEMARLRTVWQHDRRPVVYEDADEQLVLDPALVPEAVRSAVLFPLPHDDGALGVVVAGFPERGGPCPADLETGQALAGLAAAAIDRAGLDNALRLRLRQVEALYRLSDVVAGSANLDVTVGQLSELFRSELGVAFGTVAIDNREVADTVGARRPSGAEREALIAWRALRSGEEGLRPHPSPTGLLVPVATRKRVLGVLPMSVDEVMLDEADWDLLTALGAACGEVVYKAGLRRKLGEQERRLLVAGERERIARDLHDSVAQLLTGLGLRVTQFIEEAPDDLWRTRLEGVVELASRGSDEVRQAIYSLLFLQARRHGLVPSLRELARTFETTTGIAVSVRVKGRDDRVPAAKEDALFRAAHEALMNVERHARATAVVVTLAFDRAEVALTVEDDGVGLRGAGTSADRGHFGLTGLRELLEEQGGKLRVRDGSNGGAILLARVPNANGASG